MGSAGFNY